ncbi:MAG: hypothetical protein OMM_06799 [Candidatus Magnetoglobus multicellularis str. Araruama]|uniref:DUF4435 domain-containing protein n=1 Tax=Candidatus Magnetoglobus multicellularis str. Araruama TaxID=890399 RepID=A0A1V1PFU2_9BACT|nr:MAG: hypothetical protein OMM_06799 [Candidatus Magnetoglobus multicellularis str. Araruama]
MPDICKYEGNQVLLVEGKSDCHSILALCKFFNLPQTFGIYQCGNDIGVLKRLNALIIQPATPISVGIVMDADAPDVAGRWIQIREKLKIINTHFQNHLIHMEQSLQDQMISQILAYG